MLKRLAILGLAGGLICGAWSQIAKNRSQQDQKPQQGQIQTSIPKTVLPPAIDAQQATFEQKSDSNAKPPAYQWRELLAPSNISNWCLVLVGIWAGGMAYWTLRNIEKQTEQLKGQASLMREQMEMMLHKDRARLYLDVQTLELVRGEEGFYHLVTCIELTNIGQSKAYITFSAGRFVITPCGQDGLPQPDPDEFSPISNVIETSGEPIYAPFFIDDVPLDFGVFVEKFASGELTAYHYCPATS
jgi:hypothetical protein